MPTTLRIALLAGLLALLSNLAVIGFIYVRTHDEAVASLHRQVAEQSKVLTDVYRSGGKAALDDAIDDTLAYADPQTAVAMTRVGTTTEQATVTSTLDRIAADARAARMSPPAVTVVGEVVDLRETLSWFETKPLFGWRVLVPRTKEQAGSLSERLRGYGAVPDEVPTISVEPPRSPAQMERAVKGLVDGRFQWIVFTSANAVKAVWEKFIEFGLDARAFSGVKIAWPWGQP